MEPLGTQWSSERKRPSRYSVGRIIWWIFLGLLMLAVILAILFGSVTAIVYEALGYAKHIHTARGVRNSDTFLPGSDYYYYDGGSSEPYIYNEPVSFYSWQWWKRVFVKFGSHEEAVYVKSPTNFDSSVKSYQLYVTGIATIDYLTANAVVLLNTTIVPPVYYLLDSALENLLSLVTQAYNTVDPPLLLEFLATQFRRRGVDTTYTSEFVEYLATTNANIIALQNSTNAILNGTYCRGKPLEVDRVQPLGDQALIAGVNQYVTWGSLVEQPTTGRPTTDFVVHGNALVAGFSGVYSTTFNANIQVPINSTGATLMSLNQNGNALYQIPCSQPQVMPTGVTDIQCQGTAQEFADHGRRSGGL